MPIISKPKASPASVMSQVQTQARPGLSMTCFSMDSAKNETKEERTMTYLERFQAISNELAGVKEQNFED